MQNDLSKAKASMNSFEFEFITEFLEEKSGIVLKKGKEYLAARNLESVCKSEGINSIKDLVWKLKTGKNVSSLTRKVIESMTINETLFFRDDQPFEDLRKHVMPRLMSLNETNKRINFWSSSCASGQEPYSIALILKQHFSQLKEWQLAITATDIDSEIIERAKSGVYNMLEVNRGLPPSMRDRYMTQEERSWKFKPEILSMVDFKVVNLIEAWPFKEKFDLITLRNTLIYFNPQVKHEILRKMHRFIKPEGYLLLSASDIFEESEVPFRQEMVGKTTFYRPIIK